MKEKDKIVNSARGNRFAQFRSNKEKSKRKFAAFLGVSYTTISDIEKGSRELSPNFILALSKKYEIENINWFETGEGDMPKLLTKKSISGSTKEQSEVIGEMQESYLLRCRKCEEKDAEIARLNRELNESNKQLIAQLKKNSG